MIHIQVSKEFSQKFEDQLLESFAKKTLGFLGINDCELSIFVGNNAEIQILNRDYRHIDSPTDVLSFNYDVMDPDTNLRYLGDIVISADKVFEQADNAGHSFEKEICTLIVHGILHLNGYDHEAETGDAIMIPLQNKIIKDIFSE